MSDTPEWPLVVENDDGIRPAGPPDECFYCQQKVGQPHGRECVIVTKRVKVRYTMEIEIVVPHDWDEHMIDFHRNDSSWCASNAVEDIKDYVDRMGEDECLCSKFKSEYLGVADDTPTRKIREPEEPETGVRLD